MAYKHIETGCIFLNPTTEIPEGYIELTQDDLDVELARTVEHSYQQKRAALYPSYLIFIDGMVKQQSTDPLIVAEGVAQVAKYAADCLSIKTLIPKEII